MKRVIKSAVLGGVLLALTGCSSTSVQYYSDMTPELDPKQFFDGRLCADGIVKDYRGRVSRHFSARINASWDSAGVGTLDEVFQFNDRVEGDYEKRIWTLVPDGTGSYLARANDVPEATRMQFAGNSLNMEYVLHYQTGEGDTVKLNMDDWMFQVNNRTIVNETRMSKFGFTVGRVILTIRKAGHSDMCLPGGLQPSNIERVSM
ncbi:DUF3833 domain-containing protein [Oceanobacter kriegii]|uniref:DUF3833 domain-containing protein n=1 Tax=Oceanobacter kriegii TaxID=64972 RepID=UPI000428EEAB|nr:DUF3833 domain-containing protein [Oceanobacter kriegii]